MRAIVCQVELTESVELSYSRVEGEMSDREFADNLELLRQRMRELIARNARHLAIVDLTNAPAPTASQRRLQVEWSARTESLTRSATLGMVFVTPSLLLRGALTALIWMRPPPAPHHVCGSVDDALRWGVVQCERAGVEVSSEALRGARQMLAQHAAVSGTSSHPR